MISLGLLDTVTSLILIEEKASILFHRPIRMVLLTRPSNIFLVLCCLSVACRVQSFLQIKTPLRRRDILSCGNLISKGPSLPLPSTKIMVLRTSSGDESDSSSSQFSVQSEGKSAMTSNTDSSSNLEEPHFRIGILADIQYCPIPDGHSFVGVLRYYRHSLEVAKHAAQHFEQAGAEVVLNLGDIIDGKCQAITDNGGDPLPLGTDPGLRAMEDVLEALSHYKQGPIIHTYGT